MKTKILILIFLLLSYLAQAQKIEKLAKYYDEANYQKCIDKAQTLQKKYPKSPYVYYYPALAYFQFFKSSKPLKKRYFMQKSLLMTAKGLKYDTAKVVFDEFKGEFDELHDSLTAFSHRLFLKDKNTAEFFLKQLALIFNDTTDDYRKILTQKNKTNIVEQQLAFKEYSGRINYVDEKGRRQGVWIKKYDNGVVEYEIYFKNDHPAGIFRKYYPNGQLKADLYFDTSGTRAAAILYREDGSRLAMGYYWNKKKDSLWQYFWNDSIVLIEENYKRGVKDGPEYIYSPYYYPNLLEEKYWKNGKLDSIYVRYYPWGTPKSMYFYKNGVRQGPFYIFDENGRIIKKGFYKNDLPDSTWTIIDYEKNDTTIIRYKNGELLSKEYEEQQTKEIIEHLKNPAPDPWTLFRQEYGIELEDY